MGHSNKLVKVSKIKYTHVEWVANCEEKHLVYLEFSQFMNEYV